MTLAQAAWDDDGQAQEKARLEESFTRFLSENHSKILKFLHRQCFDPHLAEDALQEALIVAMDKWEIISKHEKPLYWVRRIAWHKLLRLHDRQRWQDVVPLDTIQDELQEPTGAHEAEMVLQQVLRRLPFRQRAVLALMVEGDTDEQIARQLGLALTTVVTYKSDVRKKYREEGWYASR
jgi:RNA polymerase sigma factor (sigma-70 family)